MMQTLSEQDRSHAVQTSQTTVAAAINNALHRLFEDDPRVHLLGEDILDPYGGAFKISKGLSTRFPERILATPISEAAIVGISGGMALRGLRPVVEIMFGDFITLAFDQILNHITKFPAMYNGQVSCPVAIRTPMGGGRGYGPTHSQSLEKFFIGVPGLDVVAISPLHDIENFYRQAITVTDTPTLIIEHKLLYPQSTCDVDSERYREFAIRRTVAPYPTVSLSLNNFRRADITLITYGGTTRLALEAARHALIEHEVVVEVLVLGQLSPLPTDDIIESVARSRRAITLEEGTARLGIGAEIASQIQERLFGSLAAPVLRVAASDSVIPAARGLEDEVLPALTDVEQAVLQLMGRS